MKKLIRTLAVLAVIVIFSATSGLAKPLVKDEVLIPKTPTRPWKCLKILG